MPLPDEPVQFTRAASSRIARAVTALESQIRQPLSRRGPTPQILHRPGGIRFLCDMDVPAFGIMVPDYDASPEPNEDAVSLTQCSKLIPGMFYVNGSTDVPAGTVGYCSLADEPTSALVADCFKMPDLTWATAYYAASIQWGPAPGSWGLHFGLPGFVTTGLFAEDFSTVKVQRQTYCHFWGWATENWHCQDNDDHYVTVRVFIGDVIHHYLPEHLFDGEYEFLEGQGPVPDVTVAVWLPNYSTNQYFYGVNTRMPNVEEGNILLCGGVNYYGTPFNWISLSDYLDDAIGSIKLWCTYDPQSGEYDIPQGWARMDGSENSSGNGGSGLDMRGRFVVGLDPSDSAYDSIGDVGGTKTHTHGSTQKTTGTEAASALSEINHLPPYNTLMFIERIDNSAEE